MFLPSLWPMRTLLFCAAIENKDRKISVIFINDYFLSTF